MTRSSLRRTARRYLPFLPSVLTGVLGTLWLLYRPAELGPRASLPTLLLVGLALTLGLWGTAWLLERTLPSFRFATQLLERLVGGLRLGRLEAVMFAALTATAEELFFRGALQSLIGVWGQALVFGLLHPLPRRGWSYTLYTALSGLAFGYAVTLTGSLLPGLIAHFLINLHGLWEVSRRR
jgi:membrane protease YdiL (CAAX protease family)